MASISAGREIRENDFIGAAPDSEIIVVKLKRAKPYFIEQMRVRDGAVAFESSDLMTGIEYVYNKSVELKRPVAICDCVIIRLNLKFKLSL